MRSRTCLAFSTRAFSSSAHRPAFFFNYTAPTEIYTSIDTLSLHDALPISAAWGGRLLLLIVLCLSATHVFRSEEHTSELQSPIDISYAVFCLKKKSTLLSLMCFDTMARTLSGFAFALLGVLGALSLWNLRAAPDSFFFLMIPRPPTFTRRLTLFPYTTLFRSLGLSERDYLRAAAVAGAGLAAS